MVRLAGRHGRAQDRECQLRHDAEHEQIVLQPRVPQDAVLRDCRTRQELLDLVNNELSPFVEKFTMRDLDIMSVNADGSVSSSTGLMEEQPRPPSRRTTIPPPAHRPAQGTAARRPTRVRPPIPAIPQTTAARRSTPAIPVTTAGGTTVDPGNTGDNSGTTTPSEPRSTP